MKDLSQIAGVSVKLEDIGLVFDQENFPVEPKTRTLSEAKEVYLEKDSEDQDLYYMYRYFEDESHEQVFDQAGLEYDLTAIKPGKIGPEFIKTAGHFHGYVPGTEITYPEVYELLSGTAEYLLQTKPDADGNVDVVIVTATPGQKIVVPPNYGHISINTGDDFLVEDNLQLKDLPASADYESFAVNNGAALYHTADGWKENENYKIRSLRKVAPKEKPEWGLTDAKPLYTAFLENPAQFDFLAHPQNYDFSDVWEEVLPN